MTEEQKNALINRCKNRIAFYKAAGNTGTFDADTLQLTEIALAALTAPPVKLPQLELVATLTLKDSEYEWERICYIPDGDHDLYIIKEGGE